jgi:hypothetical protein
MVVCAAVGSLIWIAGPPVPADQSAHRHRLHGNGGMFVVGMNVRGAKRAAAITQPPAAALTLQGWAIN